MKVTTIWIGEYEDAALIKIVTWDQAKIDKWIMANNVGRGSTSLAWEGGTYDVEE